MKRLFVLCFLFLTFSSDFAQTCNVIFPNSFGIPCGSNCVDLKFKLPSIKTTENYVLDSIGYSPLPYNYSGSTELPVLYCDDIYSGVINLPFKVCFYGRVFEKMVVGSNGLITFDTANKDEFNGYSINNPIPTSNGGGIGGTGYYPRAAIMAAFTDLDPTQNNAPIQPSSCSNGGFGLNGSPLNRRIEYSIQGVAPCRKIVVNYYRIGMYGSSSGVWSATGTNCNSLNPGDYQIVIEEGTNIVKVNFAKKLCLSTTAGNGKTITGIQNWERDAAVTPPGKNATAWTDQNKSYVFKPNGSTNLLQNVVIKKKNGTIVGNGTLGVLTGDSVEVTYNNYCVSGTGIIRDTLIMEAVYKLCAANATDSIKLIDTIYIEKNPADLLATATTTSAICLSSNGSVTINVPAGAGTAPYQYALGTGSYGTSNTFSGLAVGTYIIYVKDDSGVCTDTLQVNIPLSNPVTATGVAVAPSCAGAANGSITVSANNAASPIQYNINGGTFQTSNIFTGLVAGTYSIIVKDNNGCQRNIFVTVPVGSGTIAGTISVTQTTCPGASNGSITANGTTGTAPYQYALGTSGTFGPSNTFTGLAAGVYTVRIKDANGCIVSYSANVTNGPGITATSTTTQATCTGINNGSITVTANNGSTPYQYAINGGVNQPSNVFNMLAPGTYTIKITDNQGCFVIISSTITAGTGINTTSSATATTCVGVNNGSITVNASNGVVPYSFSLNGGTPQGSGTFTGLAAGSYTVLVTDNVGCTRSVNVSVLAGAGINATFSTTPASCTTANNGVITVTATNGSTPYSYALDGALPQSSNTFSNVSPGNHTVVVTDNVGCTKSLSVTVAAGTGFNLSANTTAATCSTATNGSITINTVGGVIPFSYSINGATPQGNNVFNNLAVGTYAVTVTDNVGCIKTINVSVLAGSGISVSATQTPTSCSGASNGQVTVLATAGTSPYSYAIDGGMPQASNVFNNLAAGSHTILVTDDGGCSKTINITVTTGVLFTLSQTTTVATCATANNGTATITVNGGASPLQYAIDGGTNQLSNVFQNLSAGSHTVVVTDNVGCSNSIVFTIGVGAGISATSSSTAVLCNGGNTGSINITPSNGQIPYTFALGTNPPQTSNIFANLTAGNYTITVTDDVGCATTVSAVVNQPPLLSAIATATPTICNGQSNGVITVTASGGSPAYFYSIDGGMNYQNINNFNVAAGSYVVTVKDNNDCLTTVPITVAQPNVINITTASTPASCNGGADGTITINATGGTGAFTYSIDGTNFTTNNIFNVTQGTYTLTAKDANGCTATNTTVVGFSSNIILIPQNDTTLCEGSSDTLTLQTNATSFMWTPAVGLSATNIANPIVSPVVTTKYFVTATLGGCSLTDSILVTVNPAPIPNAGNDVVVCFGQSAQLQGSGGVAYIWWPNSNINNATISNPLVNTNATTTYYLHVKDANGCTSLKADTVTVVVTPPLQVDAGKDTTIVMNQPYQMSSTLVGYSNIGATFLWTPSFGLNNSAIQNPIATINVPTTYVVQITTPAGCKGLDTVKLNVLVGPTIYVPTVFTPNNDGKNDLFKVVPVGISKINFIRLYNRWGQEVFATTNANIGWDARNKGVEQPTGAYVYYVQGVTDTGKVLSFKGTVLLAR